MAATSSDHGRKQQRRGRTSPAAHTAKRAATHAESLLDDATGLVDHALEVKAAWEKRLHQATAHHPYLALAGASGAGFVLGGGLTLGLTKRLWVTGARLALSLAMQRASQTDFVRQLLGGSDA